MECTSNDVSSPRLGPDVLASYIDPNVFGTDKPLTFLARSVLSELAKSVQAFCTTRYCLEERYEHGEEEPVVLQPRMGCSLQEAFEGIISQINQHRVELPLADLYQEHRPDLDNFKIVKCRGPLSILFEDRDLAERLFSALRKAFGLVLSIEPGSFMDCFGSYGGRRRETRAVRLNRLGVFDLPVEVRKARDEYHRLRSLNALPDTTLCCGSSQIAADSSVLQIGSGLLDAYSQDNGNGGSIEFPMSVRPLVDYLEGSLNSLDTLSSEALQDLLEVANFADARGIGAECALRLAYLRG